MIVPGPPGYMMISLKYYGMVPFSEDTSPELYRVFESKDEKNSEDEEGPNGLAGVAWRALGDLRIKVFSILIDFEKKCDEQQEEIDSHLYPWVGDRASVLNMLNRDVATLGYHVEKLSRTEDGRIAIPEKVAEVANLIFDTCMKDGSRIRYEGGASWLTRAGNQRFARATGRLVERLKNPNPDEERPIPSGPTPTKDEGSMLGKRYSFD